MNFGEILKGPLTPFKNFNIVFIALFALVVLISFNLGDPKSASFQIHTLVTNIFNGVVTLLFTGYCVNYFKTKYLLSDSEVNVSIDAGNFVKTGLKFYLFGLLLGIYLAVFWLPLFILGGIAFGALAAHQIAIAVIMLLVLITVGIRLTIKLYKYALVATLRYLQTDDVKEGWNIRDINSIIKLNNKSLESYIWVAVGLSVIYITSFLFSSVFLLINKIFASALLGILTWYSTIVFYDMYGSMLDNIAIQPQEAG
ncbi:MAG: DUF4013 domain-containing protein [Candidatus Gastranaerophilales bacterium]|nr:DUF4013 domain-containing protein [Candidatus Gastranaerophilales bacterium]